MRGSKRFFRMFLVGLFAACLVYISSAGIPTDAFAADQAVAVMTIQADQITWQPQVTYESLVLTVSGPGEVLFTQSFEAGSNPYLGLSDQAENRFPDGQYAYELRVTPVLPAEVRKALAGARESGDRSVVEALQKTGQLSEALVQSGYFLINAGMFVTGSGLEEEKEELVFAFGGSLDAPQDYPINDDLIVDGSACVGLDCVNGESFGFDTLRLKENNLRIKFQDTSNSASFPTNDWQLTANDSSNGGANKFSIDDIDGGRTPFTVEAGARSNALYVESDGDIGIGTNNPAVDVEIVTGNTPTLRLHQDGSSGFTPQTWDVAGNETNFFIRDVTNGSTLPFRIRPGAATSSIDIATNGEVGIGTSSPDAKVEIQLSSDDTNYKAFFIENTHASITDSNLLRVMADGNAYFAGDLELGSSRAYKENIQDLSAADALAAVTQLRPVSYNRKANPTEQSLGFIAEEVPEFVATTGRRSINPMDIMTVLTKAVQEQQTLIQEQQTLLQEQQAVISELSEKLMQLEQRLNGE